MSDWERLPPWAGTIHQGCNICPPVLDVAPLEMLIAVGFGEATVTRDSVEVYNEMDLSEDAEFPTLARFEAMAAEDPDHDWRVSLQAPLRGRVYQRHDVGRWVLIDSNEGFA